MILGNSFRKANIIAYEEAKDFYARMKSMFENMDDNKFKIAIANAHASLFKRSKYPAEHSETLEYIATAALIEVAYARQGAHTSTILKGQEADSMWMEKELREIGLRLGLHTLERTVLKDGKSQIAYELDIYSDGTHGLMDARLLEPYQGQSWTPVYEDLGGGMSKAEMNAAKKRLADLKVQ